MLSDIKLKQLQDLNAQQFWPLIKQQLDVVQMCYIVYALQQWQLSGCVGSFQSYFDERKTRPEFGSLSSSTNYRMVSNAHVYGFTNNYFKNGKNASEAQITPVFKLIQDICKSNFSKRELYQHIIDSQLEKIYVNTDKFKIHTVMFLLKILLTIGDLTGKFSISFSEMKLFVVNAEKWSDYLMVADAILRYRTDSDYRRECNEQSVKFKDSRYNSLVSNLSYIDTSNNSVTLVESAIKSIRLKIAKYENLGKEEVDRRMHEDFLTEPQDDANKISVSLQKIVYGAPGSGKSHKVRKEVKNSDHRRVTFHPDTDYSSFVGAYKPIQDGEKIKYSFAPQQFAKAYVDAWGQYIKNPGKKYYLVIEEINRGNCAQIFGDIFQLLDRGEDGFSVYPISVDTDFASYIKSQMEHCGCLKEYLKFYDNDNTDCESIKFPPNFHIIATMNTSDQSLFPMDSAFKRRWEWIYVPIDSKDASLFTIVIDDKHHYNWGAFISAVNDRIYSATGSPDKQLGNRFVNVGPDNIIDFNQFQGKVLFYLWDEVFKDNKRNSIFAKDKGFYKIYGNIDEICSIIEETLGVTNEIVLPKEEPTTNEQ